MQSHLIHYSEVAEKFRPVYGACKPSTPGRKKIIILSFFFFFSGTGSRLFNYDWPFLFFSLECKIRGIFGGEKFFLN